jgi:signal transduction histidine kinase
MTIIRNESDLTIIRDKIQGMLDIIERSLARARAAPSATLLAASTPILPVLQDIAAGFGKLHGKAVGIDYPPEHRFKGDKADLYEILGNIIENACKFSRSTVRIGDRDGVILVEDDGDGIPAARRGEVLERGTRLDRSTPGTGIGLAVARDIVALYDGAIGLESSALGGLQVSIRLPLQR